MMNSSVLEYQCISEFLPDNQEDRAWGVYGEIPREIFINIP